MPAPTMTTRRSPRSATARSLARFSSVREPELAGGLRVAVGEERRAPLLLVPLPDRAGGPRQGRQGTQEPAVRLVLPRDRALPAPAGAAQRVEPAVVPGARVGVRLDRPARRERLLGEHGPRQAHRRVRRRELVGG